MGAGASKPQQHSAKLSPSPRSKSSISVVESEKPLDSSTDVPDDKPLQTKASGNAFHPPTTSGKTPQQPKSSGNKAHPSKASDNTAHMHPPKASGSKARSRKASSKTTYPPKASGNTSYPSTSGKTSKVSSFLGQPADQSPPELPESLSQSEESTEEEQSEDEDNQEMEVPQEALSNVLRCNICFETLVQPRTLPCQHNYCHACLAKYIRINYRHVLLFKRKKAVVCPVCKTPGAVPNPDRDPDGKDWAEQFKPGLAIQQLLDARVPVSQGHKDATRTTSLHKSLQRKASMPLHRACQQGELDVVKTIISKGKTDINSRDMTLGGMTPVMAAAHHGQKAVCAYLIKQGCDLSAVDVNGNTLLHWSCFGGDLNMIKTLIKKKIFHINIMNTKNQTPISYAAAGGHVDVFTYFTNMGCDVTGVDVYNNNILHAACEGDSVEMVKHIMSLNVVDKEKRGQYGRTPLMKVAGSGHLELFNFLIITGCDIRAVDEDGNNILHVACIGGNVEMVKHIMSLNVVDKESRGQYGRTPLMNAAEFGQQELFNFLIATGCDMRAVDEAGNNILHVACVGGNVEMVKHILSLNVVDKESKGQYGRTPLMKVAGSGHLELFNFLIITGCDIRAVDEDGNNILHVACIGGNVEMVKHIMSLNVVDKESRGQYGRTPLMNAAEFGQQELFNFLIATGCDMRAVDEAGNNILHVACVGGNVEMVKHILSLNVVDKESRGHMDKTPLLTAAAYGHVELFKFLSSKGCNITARNEVNGTVLHCACVGGTVDMVKHLKSIPAVRDMIHLKTSLGKTAADVAQEVGHHDIVAILKRH